MWPIQPQIQAAHILFVIAVDLFLMNAKMRLKEKTKMKSLTFCIVISKIQAFI